ncbi:unnamed protein product [Clavelina lepadiformis]|uniref:Uncharacterized protein n=1 Tax=Clavelina lepadiformis TaxID=159417 RepID=A0ABP0G924_CLALP
MEGQNKPFTIGFLAVCGVAQGYADLFLCVGICGTNSNHLPSSSIFLKSSFYSQASREFIGRSCQVIAGMKIKATRRGWSTTPRLETDSGFVRVNLHDIRVRTNPNNLPRRTSLVFSTLNCSCKGG